MKTVVRVTLVVAALLGIANSVCLRAQITAANAKAVTVEDRRKALNDVFHDYWEDVLQHDPEFASTIGDTRFNDKISDYSVKAYNASLERGQSFIMRLAAIDPGGLNDQEQLSRELLQRTLVDDQEAAQYKEWEMPINQMGGIHVEYPQVVNQLSFKTVKDYDDWIARLHTIPHAFSQITENMSIGMEDQRTPPRYLMEKVLEQVQTIAAQKPEDSPLALPLKSIPAAIPHPHRNACRHSEGGAARLHALRHLPEDRVHSSLPHRIGHLRTGRRCQILPVPCSPHDDDRSHRRSDPPDRARRSKAR